MRKELQLSFEVNSFIESEIKRVNHSMSPDSGLWLSISQRVLNLKDIFKSDNILGKIEDDIAKVIPTLNFSTLLQSRR